MQAGGLLIGTPKRFTKFLRILYYRKCLFYHAAKKTIYTKTSYGKIASMDTRSLHEKLWKRMPDLGIVHIGGGNV